MNKSAPNALPKESVAAARKQSQAWFRHPYCTPEIYHFLSTYWLDMLTRAHAAAGEQGAGWLGGIRIAEALLWSISPKNDQDERLKLVKSLPTLLKAIETAMRQQQASEDEIEEFLAHMAEKHAVALRGEPRPAEPPASVIEPPETAPEAAPAQPAATAAQPTPIPAVAAEEPAVIEQAAEAVKPFEASDTRPAAPELDELPAKIDPVRQQVDDMPKGTIIEFQRSTSSPIRCRLQWVSPSRRVFLFTSKDASHAIRISPESLTERLRGGSATVVQDDDES